MLRGLDGYLLILVVGQHCGFQAPGWTRRRLASLSAARGLRRRSLTLFGGHSEGETPLPIPNRAVKPLRADGTWPSRAWESRSPPNYFSIRAALRGGPTAFWGPRALPRGRALGRPGPRAGSGRGGAVRYRGSGRARRAVARC